MINRETILEILKNNNLDLLQSAITEGDLNIYETYGKGKHTIIHLIAFYGTVEALDIVLAKADTLQKQRLVAIINDHGTTDRSTALCCAARAGNTEVAKRLIEKGANMNLQNRNGLSPLHYLASKPKLFTLFEHLVNKGAKLESTTAHGRTPLHYAASFNNFLAINLLNNFKVDLDAQCNNGFTPLHYAVIGDESRVEALDALIKCNANPDVQDNRRNTPLYYVYDLEKNKEFTSLLEKAGANIHIRCNHGFTPFFAKLLRQKDAFERVEKFTYNSMLNFISLTFFGCIASGAISFNLATMGTTMLATFSSPVVLAPLLLCASIYIISEIACMYLSHCMQKEMYAEPEKA